MAEVLKPEFMNEKIMKIIKCIDVLVHDKKLWFKD